MQWSTINTSPLPQPREGHSISTTRTRLVLYAGSSQQGDTNLLDDTWLYDSLSYSWTQLQTSNTPLARSHHAATIQGCDENKYGERIGGPCNLVILGGKQQSFTGTYVYGTDLWYLNLDEQIWTQISNPN